jgi:deoxyxylulose-5-phosphate synthase
LWNADDAWTPVTEWRRQRDAKVAVLGLGAPSYLAGAASDAAMTKGVAADVYVINGLPLEPGFLEGLSARYTKVVTVEDGLIGTVESGLRGFAGLVSSALYGSGTTLDHFGIIDPHIAPSDHFVRVWEHYGITAEAIEQSIVGSR